jgi:hypothetical protein
VADAWTTAVVDCAVAWEAAAVLSCAQTVPPAPMHPTSDRLAAKVLRELVFIRHVQ